MKEHVKNVQETFYSMVLNLDICDAIEFRLHRRPWILDLIEDILISSLISLSISASLMNESTEIFLANFCIIFLAKGDIAPPLVIIQG